MKVGALVDAMYRYQDGLQHPNNLDVVHIGILTALRGYTELTLDKKTTVTQIPELGMHIPPIQQF